jgi:hypothetical protein
MSTLIENIYTCSICEEEFNFGKFNLHVVREHKEELLSTLLGILNGKYDDEPLKRLASRIDEKEIKVSFTH